MSNSQFTVSEKAHAKLEQDFEHLRSTVENRAEQADRSVERANAALLRDDGLEAIMLLSLVREDLSTILNHTRAMKRQTSDGKDTQ